MNPSGLIVGLGNPGREYEGTRHNFGFLALDALTEACRELGRLSVVSGRSDPYILERCSLRLPAVGDCDWLFAKPLTYMNKSGEAVRRISDYYRVSAHAILVIHDELDLPLGRMRMKQGGGNAGHNGLKSIQQHLGTPDFHRLRLGIGKSPYGDNASYVLSRFSGQETPVTAAVAAAAAQGLLLFMRGDPPAALQHCNGFTVPS